jgi:uncharacterized protein Usg
MLPAFLEHWRREVEAALHSGRIVRAQSTKPAERRAVDSVISIQ